MIRQLLRRETGQLSGRLHRQGRNYFADIQLFGHGQRLGAEVIEVVGRRQPHALLALGHAREELGVLAIRVMWAFEVVPSRKVVQEPHALVLGGE